MSRASTAALVVAVWSSALAGCANRSDGEPRPAPAAEPAAATVDEWAADRFRATGNEPGWRLDMDGERLTLLVDGAATRIVVATPRPTGGHGRERYETRTDRGPLVVTILARRCADTMTGMPYPNTVEIDLGGRKLSGCGGDPAMLLHGAEWVVESIDGRPVAERTRATLRFDADGRITGSASCNAYFGAYSLSGEGLVVDGIAATRRACAPPLMRQEEAFLQVLGGIRRFELHPDGTLVLHAADRRTLAARRGPSAR